MRFPSSRPQPIRIRPVQPNEAESAAHELRARAAKWNCERTELIETRNVSSVDEAAVLAMLDPHEAWPDKWASKRGACRGYNISKKRW